MSIPTGAEEIPADLLTSGYTVSATVESWLGSQYLGEVPGPRTGRVGVGTLASRCRAPCP